MNFKLIFRNFCFKVQIHRSTPVQSAPSPNIEGGEEEEIQQLRTNLSILTAQCTQLNEANLAWQQFHQNQLEIFRNKLQDWILLDENSTLEQIAQQIVIQFDQLGIHISHILNTEIETRMRILKDKKILIFFVFCSLKFNN